MITAEMRVHMRRLVLVAGWRIETVAHRFDVHQSPVRRALRDDAGGRPAPSSALDPYKPYIVERLVELPADDQVGRENLLKYMLRPPLAARRIRRLENGLVRLGLKRVVADARLETTKTRRIDATGRSTMREDKSGLWRTIADEPRAPAVVPV